MILFRTNFLPWWLPILFIALPACSTSQGFDRAGIQETLRHRLDLIDERTAQGPADRTATLAAPFRLGVYFVRSEFPTRESVRSMEWLGVEKDRLLQGLGPLRDNRIVRDVMILADSTILNLSRGELRQAAGRHGIDVLLLVDGIGAVDRHNNAYSLLYPTILGAYAAPGTVSDALFVIDGLLWDLRTDRLLDRITSEGQARSVGTAVAIVDAAVLREAKRQAIETFGTGLVDQLRSFAGTRPDAPSPSR